MDPKYAKWKGAAREEIDWAPRIDPEKCVGCGMCLTSCGRDVFDFDADKGKAVTARPLQCMVGCTSCQVWCIYGAITFPAPEVVRDFIREKKILLAAKKQLLDRIREKAEQQAARSDEA
jgi:NAD-dependent dihydropyrimidine dehydrogenase PreA subunit